MSGKRERPGPRLRYLAILSLAYGAVMVSLGGTLYGWSPYHRLQAEALLHGHFYLADNIEQIQPGLAWHDGHVQQVWGLGVGVWLLPFQAVWSVFSNERLPDRIVMGFCFALLAFYMLPTALRFAKLDNRPTAIGVTWLILLCPPLWTLIRASQLVFEETAVYGLIFCLTILVAVVRVVLFDSRRDFWICCVLAAFSGFIRPTLAVYGLFGVMTVSLVLPFRHKRAKEILFGTLILLTGFLLLAATNRIRFGSAFEFGHRLTLSSDSMVYLTRFGNPYASVITSDATKELFGALFLDSNVRDVNAFSENQFPGQSPATRWRRLYFSSFDMTYFTLIVISLAGAAFYAVLHVREKGSPSQHNPRADLRIALTVWSFGSALGLAVFYFHFPIITSRYLLDFLPAIAGFLILAWLVLPNRLQWPFLAVLGPWLAFEILSAKAPIFDQGIRLAPLDSLPQARGRAIHEYNGKYTATNHPSATAIIGNGYGWEPESGFAGPIVILAVDNPHFIEFHASDRREINGEPARKDVYRAMLDGLSLLPDSVTTEKGEQIVRFNLPEFQRRGNKLLFLSFSAKYDAEDRTSERFLYSVSWK